MTIYECWVSSVLYAVAFDVGDLEIVPLSSRFFHTLCAVVFEIHLCNLSYYLISVDTHDSWELLW